MIAAALTVAGLGVPVALGRYQESIESLVVRALASSPSVSARRSQAEQAKAVARSLGRPANPELEISPGVGFTNSNFVLGQSFDLGGVRAARARAAQADAEAAVAELAREKAAVAARLLEALAEYRSNLDAQAGADSSAAIAQATANGLRKRVEAGEAPAVHLTRAEIELGRAEQSAALARSDLATSRARANSLLGRPLDDELPAFSWLPGFDHRPLVEGALGRRPEAMAATSAIARARAEELEARRMGSPSLFAGVASDVWSADRRPFHRDNLGLQIRVSLPLLDLGERRHAIRAAQSALKSSEAELAEVRRLVDLEIVTAARTLDSSRAMASKLRSELLPKAEQMVKAMLSGMEAGLTTYLEVLEAQRALSQVRREATEADLRQAKAEVRFLAAVAALPGLEDPRS